MTELTTEYLDLVMKDRDDDEIYRTALSMKEKMAALDQEDDLDTLRALTESLMEEFSLLKHLLDEWSRSGEDFINDSVFHEKH